MTVPSAAERAARLAQAVAAFQQGDVALVVDAASQAHADALAAGDRAMAADAALLLARTHFNHLDGAGTLRWVDEALRAAGDDGARYVRARAGSIAAAVHAMNDDAQRAMHELERAAALLDASIAPEERSLLVMSAGVCYHALGMSQQAMRTFRESVDLYAAGRPTLTGLIRRVNLLHAAANAFDQLVAADAAQACALLEGVLPDIVALEAEARALDSRFAWATHCLYAGGVLRRLGRLAEAQVLLDPRHWDDAPLPEPVRRERMIDRALLLRDCGDIAGARATALAARQMARAEGGRRSRALDTLHDSQLAEILGEHQVALSMFQQHHAVVLRNEHVAFDARLAELNATLRAHTLSLENADLRAHNAGLTMTFKQLSDLASTDALTGIANRRGLESAFAGAQSAGRGVAMLMIDLDHFKQVNDGCSHLVGDQVLQQAARLMALALRDADLLGRFGGEEFTALLADTTQVDAQVVADRLRLRLRDFDWTPMVGNLPVTVSVGLVQVRSGESFEHAAARADRLLYRAKQNGRDRVVAEGDATS